MKAIPLQTSLLFALLAIPATAVPTTVFYDDFQDEATGAKPAIATTSTGAGDAADVGTSWDSGTGTLPAIASGLSGMSTRALNLGFGSGAFSSAKFPSTGLDGTVITFDLYADYTSAGSQTCNIFGYSGGNLLFNLQVARGHTWAINNITSATSPAPAATVNGDGASILRTVTLTLHKDKYDLLFTGASGATFSASGLSYYSTTIPTTFDQVRFSNEAATASTRVMYVDNVSVVNTPPPNSAPVMVIANAGTSPVATNASANYSFSATDYEGDQVQFEVDWGDGTTQPLSTAQAVTSAYVVPHTYTSPGTYQIMARAVDASNTGTSLVNIQAVVVVNKNDTWTGAADGQWSIDNSNPVKNWVLTSDGVTPTDFEDSDNVLFDNTASVTTVSLFSGDILPASVTFDNDTAHPYTLTGYNGITGAGGLTKNGTGTLTLSNFNSYSGPTTINNGRVRLVSALSIGSGAITLSGGAVSSDGSAARSLTNAVSLTGSATFGDDTDNGDLTLSGGLSGTGSLIKAGTGLLSLSGANTYTGGTTINAGTLQFGSGGTTGTVPTSSPIVNNGALVINHSDSLAQGTTFPAMSGTGALTKAGTGTLTLNATNAYSGGTTITGGIVEADASGAIGSGTVTIAGGMRLALGSGVSISNPIVINNNTSSQGSGLIQALAGTVTVSGPINITKAPAGGGHFYAAGSSVLNVTGAITSSVPVVTRNGNVVFSGGGSGFSNLTLTGTASIGATNGIATSAVVDVAVSGTGSLDLAGFNQRLAGLARSSSNTATVTSSSGTPVLTLSNTATSTYAGIISGPLSLKKTNTGTQVLTGSNTYTGATAINSGILQIDGSNSSAVTVSGGTLAGSGTLTGTVSSAVGATIAPGTATTTGTLHTGSTTLGGALVIKVNATAADKLSATGNLTINSGSTVSVSLLGGGFTQGSYVIAECTGSLSGTFTSIPAGYQVTYSATQATLTRTGSTYAGWASANAGGQAANADYDNDGVPNGVEYFMGQTGSSFTPNPQVISGAITWPRDPSANATYVIETSTDLATWTTATTGVTEDATSVRFTLPTDGPKIFARIRVTLP